MMEIDRYICEKGHKIQLKRYRRQKPRLKVTCRCGKNAPLIVIKED